MKFVNLFGLLSCLMLVACFNKKEEAAAQEPAAQEQTQSDEAAASAEGEAVESSTAA